MLVHFPGILLERIGVIYAALFQQWLRLNIIMRKTFTTCNSSLKVSLKTQLTLSIVALGSAPQIDTHSDPVDQRHFTTSSSASTTGITISL